MSRIARRGRTLTITADDFGLSPLYDRGILVAAKAGAIDAASVMVLRSPAQIDDLLACGVGVGLHLERRGEEALTERDALAQIERFERLAGRPPDHLDGHHHCHTAGGVAGTVADLAAGLAIPVRSIDEPHRELLREAGASTPDQLVGRYDESQQVVPVELAQPTPAAAWIEWMVHPGYPDPDSGSSYDHGRREDLEAVLSFRPDPDLLRTVPSS